MHEHIGLFTYHFFNKNALRQLYHMCLDCFKPYEYHCNLIEYVLEGFVLFASSNLNPLGIFMYISLFMDPYKYALTVLVRYKSNPLEIARALLYKCSSILNMLYTLRLLDYR